jgi:hypothetical protein
MENTRRKALFMCAVREVSDGTGTSVHLIKGLILLTAKIAVTEASRFSSVAGIMRLTADSTAGRHHASKSAVSENNAQAKNSRRTLDAIDGVHASGITQQR